MVVKGAKCLVGVLCVPKQFQPKTNMVRQHLRDEIVSPLSVNVLMNRKNDNNPSVIQDVCEKEAEKKVQECNIVMTPDLSKHYMSKASTITQHLKAEVVSPVSGNIFDDRKFENDSASSMIQDACKEEAKKKIQEYINTLKSGDSKQIQQFKDKLVLSANKLRIIPIAPTTIIPDHASEETKKPEECNNKLKPGDSKQIHHFKDEVALSGNKLLNRKMNILSTTTIIADHAGEETNKAKECNIILDSAVPKQFEIPQHLKDEVVSTLAGKIFVNRKTDNDPITSTIQDPCEEEVKKNSQECNTVVTDIPKLFQANASSVKKQLKEEVMFPMPENILVKGKIINSPKTSIIQDRGESIKKAQACDVTMKPTDNLKKTKSVESTSDKQHFSLNKKPPLSEKLGVAMHVRFNLGVQPEKELKQCKIVPKCQNLREDAPKMNAISANDISQGPKSPVYASKVSVGGSKPIAMQQPKSK